MKWTSARLSVGLALLSALTLGAQTKRASIGREVSVPTHLQDGQEFTISLPALLAHGLLMFNATWTEQEGGGRPLTNGTGRPLADPSRPLTGTRAFNRRPRLMPARARPATTRRTASSAVAATS